MTDNSIVTKYSPLAELEHRLPRQFLPWLVWFIATGFVLFQFQLQLCSGPMVDHLMSSFSITALGAGVLASTFYYVYVIMQVPAGMLIDRYGARKLLSISSVICTLGCILFAYATNFAIAELGRILMGAGSSFAFVGALFLISRWFPVARFALLMGMSDMIGSFGSFAGNVGLAASVAAYSWRASMKFAAGISLVLAVLVILFVQNYPSGKEREHQPKGLSVFARQVKEVLLKKELWLYGIYVGILFSVIAVFSGLWGIPLIRLQAGVSNTMATSLASITFLGLGVACPIMGWLFPRIRRPRFMLVGCALFGALLTTIVIYFPPHNWLSLYCVLMFCLGATSSVYVFCFGMVQQIIDKEVQTTANGFINTLCVITVPIMQPLIGFLLHQQSSHQIVGNAEVYSLANFHVALLVIPMSLLLAAVIAWLLPRHTK